VFVVPRTATWYQLCEAKQRTLPRAAAARNRYTALLREGLFAPVFFNETINCERYVQVILRQFFSELTEEETLYGWLQQDFIYCPLGRCVYAGFFQCLRGQNCQQ
jgi:hypothetical protein